MPIGDDDGISQYRLTVEFVTGRGRAGFHMPGHALTQCWGGYFGCDSRHTPVQGESPHIPWTGPVSPYLFERRPMW